MRKILIGACILAFTLTIPLTSNAQSNVSVACPLLTRQLSVGSTGTSVSLLQKFLKSKGFFSGTMATGYFGQLTKKAVMQFQKAHDLSPIGVVGPKTRAKIATLCAGTLIPTPSNAEVNLTADQNLIPKPTVWSTARIFGGSHGASNTTPITHTIGGTISGLTGTGLILQNNGTDDLSISSGGVFTFETPVAEDESYTITVSQQPSGQTCIVTNSTGTIEQSNVTNVTVSCSKTLISIMVTPSNSSLPATITRSFTAIGYYADSSIADITPSVVWDTSDHAIATINNAGVGTGVSAGTVQVSATLGDVVGSTTLTVTDAVLTSITISPTNPNLPTGINIHYRASGIFSDGTNVDITDQATWDTNDHNTGTISSKGLATGIAVGTTQVNATLGGVTGTTNLTVTDAVLVAITVTPSDSSLPTGINSQYSAVGTFSDGSSLDITEQATWDTSNSSVATITSMGLLTGISPGTTQVSASLDSVTGNTNLTVTNATLVSITLSPNSPILPKTIDRQFTAFGIFSDATSVDITNQVTWETSNHTVAVIDYTGLGTGLNAGTVQVSATLGSISGNTTLTVSNATLVSIAISPINPAVARGSTLQLTATGTFSDSSTADITHQATWTSSSNTIATVANTDPKGTVTGVAGGATSIHAGFHAVSGNTTLHVGN